MLRYLAFFIALLSLQACASGGSSSTPSTTSAARAYSGSAAVGDFVSVTINSSAQTIAYTNHTNGDTGTYGYTLGAGGTYVINDPTGNLVTAYEVPNYAILIEANKTGPSHNTLALITAVPTQQVTASSLAVNTSYNYVSFRTAAGGVEVGTISFDGASNGTATAYWPYGNYSGGGSNPFVSTTIPGSSFALDSSGTFFTTTVQGSMSTVFGTQSGTFVVDSGVGMIFGFTKASTSAFSSAYAGSYTALVYQKTNASTTNNNVESGTASFSQVTVTIDGSGNLTAVNGNGTTVVSGTLTPVASTSYLQGSGKLPDPCNGLFTFRQISGGLQTDVFVTFQSGKAALFESFTAPTTPGGTYGYVYGVALKTS